MKAGDTVICIDDQNRYSHKGVMVRNIVESPIHLTVSEIFTCKCGKEYVRLKEVPTKIRMYCPACNTFEYTVQYYHKDRFELVDNRGDDEIEQSIDEVEQNYLELKLENLRKSNLIRSYELMTKQLEQKVKFFQLIRKYWWILAIALCIVLLAYDLFNIDLV